MLIGWGTFVATGGHKLAGSFSLLQAEMGVFMETSRDFYFDGSIEPGWALHPTAPTDRQDPEVMAYASGTRFGNLPRNMTEICGQQSFPIPPNLKLRYYNSVFLWCFGSPYLLGVGTIERD